MSSPSHFAVFFVSFCSASDVFCGVSESFCTAAR